MSLKLHNNRDKKGGDGLRSIMTDDLEHCYFCGTDENVELHHCIHGSKEMRRLSTAAHILIPCCSACHRGLNGIHGKYGKEKDLKLQALAQEIWENRRIKKGKSTQETARDDWIRMFHKDYIEEFNNYINDCKKDLVPLNRDEEELLQQLRKELCNNE